MRYEAQILALKTMLREGEDLTRIEKSFLEMFFNMEGDIERTQLFTRADYPELEELVVNTLADLSPGKEKHLALPLHISFCESLNFYYGINSIRENFCLFFYCSDLDDGSLLLSNLKRKSEFTYLSFRRSKEEDEFEVFDLQLFGEKGLFNKFQKKIIPLFSFREHIDKLRRDTVYAKDLGDPMNTFFDLMRDHIDDLGEHDKTMDNALLHEIIGHTMSKMTGKEGYIILDQVMIIHHKELHFSHGNCFFEKRMVVFFFFHDLGKGLLTATNPNGRGQTIARITSVVLPGTPGDKKGKKWASN